MPNIIHPLSDWQHEHMSFELAALHGELYRVYQQIEKERAKTGSESFAAEIGTMGDRMNNACLIIAVACLPKLEEVTQVYHDSGKAGVFIYDHIEIGRVKKWRIDGSLAVELFRRLPPEQWMQAAENGTADVGSLNQLIEVWARQYVQGYQEACPPTDAELHSGVVSLFSTGVDGTFGLQFGLGAKYTWTDATIYEQRREDELMVWRYLTDMEFNGPAESATGWVADKVLTLKGLKDTPQLQSMGGEEEWAPDHELDAEQLKMKYGWEREHPDYPRQLWRHEVVECQVSSGYWDWAYELIQQENNHNPEQCNVRLTAHYGSIEERTVTLKQVKPGVWQVTYGELMEEFHHEPLSAGKQYGEWVAHSLTCDGRVALA